MGKVKLLFGNNTEILFKKTLSLLKNEVEHLSKNNIVIVPDRLSLICEQSIFDAIGKDVYFNISVMGISKFAKKIIEESGLELIECSAFESKLLVLRAIQNVKNKFSCFSKRYNIGFVDEVYAKIEQIKSSEVKIDELITPDLDEGTLLKYKDIKLIYDEYELLRGQRCDSGAVLSLFSCVASQSEFLKNANVFFVGFDSMTRQGITMAKNVVLSVGKTVIAITSPSTQDNFRLYDTSFEESVLNVLREIDVIPEVENVECHFEENDKNVILNNLFARKKQFAKGNYLSLFSASTMFDEIETSVKSINYQIKQRGLKFSDIAICAPEEYHNYLTSKLGELDIDVYCDEKTPLIFAEPVKLILAYAQYMLRGDDKLILKIIYNDFYGLEKDKREEIGNLIYKYGRVGTILKYEKKIDETVKKELEKFAEAKVSVDEKNASEFVEIIQNLIKNLDLNQKIDEFCSKMREAGELKLEKTYLGLGMAIDAVLDELLSTIGDMAMKYSDFYELLLRAMSDKSIAGVPSGANQIFIGDYKSFYNANYLYILGMNEGLCPVVLEDSGLISDGEIENEKIKAKLEPTTKIINKRNKFKVFEVLLSAKAKCYVFYHNLDGESRVSQPSEFIRELEYLFNFSATKTVTLNSNFDESIEKSCFNAMDIYNANLNLFDGDEKSMQMTKAALISSGDLFVYNKENVAFENVGQLVLKNNKISASIIEEYNQCPRKAFLDYVLGLKKIKRDVVEANIIGNYIHKVCELFVNENLGILGGMTKEEIFASCNSICRAVLMDEQYYALKIDDNQFLLKLLYAECVRVCEFLNYEQSISKFRPTGCELRFGYKNMLKPIQLEISGGKYILSGVVDRLDEYGDYFRIVDYKTGSANNSKGKENLYYGLKLQLFLYAETAKRNLGKKLFGAFYLPIKNAFSKDDGGYSFSGFFENSLPLVYASDKKVEDGDTKSNILNVSVNVSKKTGEVSLRKKVNILGADELDAYLKYAIKMCEKTIENISNGIFDASPMDGCRACGFSKICKYAGREDIVRDENYDIKSGDFVEIIKNG